jgi:hypothetical protein
MHLVDSLEFDVALASEERAFAEQEQLQSFLRGPALRVIESVFDQVSAEARAHMARAWRPGPAAGSSERRHGPAWTGAAEVWRLDRLEIDLGPVHGPDLCGQWEKRLHERLLEQLRDRLRAWPAAAPSGATTGLAAMLEAPASMPPRHATPGGPATPGASAGPARVPGLPLSGATAQAQDDNVVVAGARRQAELDALQHYLVQGCLPWHLSWPAGRSFGAWAQGVVMRDAPALARQLRRADTGMQQRLTRRLAEQLAPAGLEHLVQALGLPGHWPLVHWVDTTAERARRTGLPGAAVAAGTLTRRLWTTVLDEALQAPASARDARTLLAALRLTAIRHAKDAAARTAQPSPSPGDQARGELHTAPAASPPSSTQTATEPPPAATVLRLRARLRHLARARASQGLEAAVRDGLRSDAAALAAWVFEEGQSAAARRWLAAGLAADTWQRLLALLAPTAATTYGPLLRRRPLGTAWMQLARSDWALTRTRLREAALAAVLLDPPAAASGPDGLRALARHAAALLNVEATSVWAVWSGPAGRRLPVLGLAESAPRGPERAMLASDDDVRPRLDNADRARLADRLAQTLRTADARSQWVDSLDGFRLSSLAAQVAPAELPWLQAWTSDSMWPLWQAAGSPARLGSPASFWTLWWARWAASRPLADAGSAADAGTGADAAAGADPGVHTRAGAAQVAHSMTGFDRAGFVDAWLRHAARRHGLPLSSYLPGLAARLKSLQRRQRRARRQAGPTRHPPPRSVAREHDDPIALVLRRARALAAAPGGRQGSAARGDRLPAAAPHAAPALHFGAADPQARAMVSAFVAPVAPNEPPPAWSGRGNAQQPRAVTALPPAAGPADSVAAVWAWLMQDSGHVVLLRRPPALRAALEAALSDAAFADELARRAPTALWPLLLAWLRPAACGSVVAAVARMAAPTQRLPDSRAESVAGIDGGPRSARPARSAPGAVPAAPAHGAALPPAGGRPPAGRPAAWRLVLQHYFVEGRPHVPGEFEQRLARGDGHRAWPEPVGTEAAARRMGRVPASHPPAPTRPTGLQVGQAVQVHNAGLVLLGAYAPRLFTLLGLTDGRRFVDADAAARAVHLLQWLVDERSDREEHLLVLNKLLCGVPPAMPLPREVVLQAREQDAGGQLLQTVISHWNALGSTSVQGLRETFLQREGRLQRDDEAWRLRVAPRAFDMLLDRLPWGYATLKLPWMKGVLHVDWR